MSGDDDPETVTATTVAAETTLSPPAETPDDRRLFLTTYIWQDGWVEHASWFSETNETSWVPIVSAWNWTPDYPALTVRFDDYMAPGSSDDFESSQLSGLWTVQPTEGVTAGVEDGGVVVRIDEGRTASQFERRVDMFHAVSVDGEFDISIRFFVEEDFYSLSAGGLSLSIGGTEEFQALITLQGNSYQSQEFLSSTGQTHAGTPADEGEGGLRIVGRTLDG